MQLGLRVLDVSVGGCALFLPDDVPAIQPGTLMNEVQIDLDIDTRLTVNLRLHHITAHQSRGSRLTPGLRVRRCDGNTLRTLQRFIDQTQKQRRLMSLD